MCFSAKELVQIALKQKSPTRHERHFEITHESICRFSRLFSLRVNTALIGVELKDTFPLQPYFFGT